MTTTTEIWRTVIYKGIKYERFQVSNLGRVMNLNYRGTGKAKLMRLTKRKDGYLVVTLSKNEETDVILVHRLVAQTFLPNPENKPCINHKIEGDEGKKMNIVYINEDGTVNKEKTTIEWCTVKENCNYGTRIERISKTQSKTVLQFTKSGEFIREWTSANECGRNGFNQSHVWSCCNGEQKTHKGYIWKYKE